MIRNYLKIAYRNLKRNKGYAFINIAGLAVGLAACLVIGLFVRHELSFDRFHPNAERAYRVVQRSDGGGGIATTLPGLAQALESRFPEIEHATEVHWAGDLFRKGENAFFVENVFRVDSAFFDIFPYELLRGDPDEVLTGPGQMVVTQSLAQKLFGDENPVGQVLCYDHGGTFVDVQITGVMEDPPTNAHFRPDALLSPTQQQRRERYDNEVLWNFFGGYLYLTLHEGSNPQALEQKITAFEKQAERPGGPRLALQSVTAIHLYSDLRDEIAPQGDVRYLYLFSAIGVLLLGIACVNYVNLSTARAAQRALEVGIRKVVGARREQLIGQFLGESVLISLIALPATLLLAQGALPLVNRLTGGAFAFDALLGGTDWLVLLGVILLVGIVAGLYPALYLSGFHPVRTLRGHGAGVGGGRLLRKGLVIFQFAASVVLIIGTLVVQFQLGYVQRKNLGLNEEHVVTFSSGDLGEQYGAFKQALLSSTRVESVTSGPPMGINHKNMAMPITDEETGEEKWLIVMDVDYDYLETLGLKLKAGRSFSRTHSSDAGQAVILSETAVKQLELGEDPVGQTVSISDEEKTVIGVIEDVHNRSLHDPIRAMAIMLHPGNNWTALVRLAPGDLETGLTELEETWAQFMPNRPFTFEFLEDRIAAQYQAERRLGRLFMLFSGLAVFVACLGLFGLAAFAVQRRTKEIGIRKVLGASVPSIVALLSKDFLKLVGVAFVLAAPVAYYAMQRWLQDFAYHIDLGPWLFIGAGVLALVIALLTVSYQAVKAALANPVGALRDE